MDYYSYANFTDSKDRIVHLSAENSSGPLGDLPLQPKPEQKLVTRPGTRDSTFQPRRDTVNWLNTNARSLDGADGFSGLQAQGNRLSVATNNTYRKQLSWSKFDVLLERNDRIWEKESVHLDHFRRRKSHKTVETYDAVTDASEEPGGHGFAKTLLGCRADLINCQDQEEWVEQWQKNDFLLTLTNSPEYFLIKREMDLYVVVSEPKRRPILREKVVQDRALSESADLSMHHRKRGGQLIRKVLETVSSIDDTKCSKPKEVVNAIVHSHQAVTIRESQNSLEFRQGFRVNMTVGVKETEIMGIRKNTSKPYRNAPHEVDFEMTINSSIGTDSAGLENVSAGQCILEKGNNLHCPTHGYQNEKSLWHSKPWLKYLATLEPSPSKCIDVITEGTKKSSKLSGPRIRLNKQFPGPSSLTREHRRLERRQSDWPQEIFCQDGGRARKLAFPTFSGEGSEIPSTNRSKYFQPGHRLSLVSSNSSRASGVNSADQSEPDADIGRMKHSKESPESKINEEYDEHDQSGTRISPGLYIKGPLDDRYLRDRSHSPSAPRGKQNALQIQQTFVKQQCRWNHTIRSLISQWNQSDAHKNTVNVSFPNLGLRKQTLPCSKNENLLQNSVVRFSHITSNDSKKIIDSGALNIPTSQVRRVKLAINKARKNEAIRQTTEVRRPGFCTFNSMRPATMLSVDYSKRKRSPSSSDVHDKRTLKSIWFSEDSPGFKAGLQIVQSVVEGARNGSNNSNVDNKNAGSTSLYPNDPQNGDIAKTSNLNTINRGHQTKKANAPLLRRFHHRWAKCMRQKLYWLQNNNGEMDQLTKNEVHPLLKLEDLKSYSLTPPSSSSVKGEDKRKQEDDTSDTFGISVASEFLHSSSDEQTAHKHRPRPGLATGRKKKVPETKPIELKGEQPLLDRTVLNLTQSVECDFERQLSHKPLEQELSETTPQNGPEEQITSKITPEQPNILSSSYDKVLNQPQMNMTPIRICEEDNASEHMTVNREANKCKKAKFQRKRKMHPPQRPIWEPIRNSRRPLWNNSTRPKATQSKQKYLRKTQRTPRQRVKQQNVIRHNRSKPFSHDNQNIRKNTILLRKTTNSAVMTKRITDDNPNKAVTRRTRRPRQRMRSITRFDDRPISMNNRSYIRNDPRSSINCRSRSGERCFGKNQSENEISNDSAEFKIKSRLRNWLHKCPHKQTEQLTRSTQNNACRNAVTTRLLDHAPSIWSSKCSTSKSEPRRLCQQLQRFKKLLMPKCKKAKRITEQNMSGARVLITQISDNNRGQLGQLVDFIAYISIVSSEVDELVLPFRACNRLRNYRKEISKLIRKLEADLFNMEGRVVRNDTKKEYNQPAAVMTDLPEGPIESAIENPLSRSASLSTHELRMATKQLSSTHRQGQVMVGRRVNQSFHQGGSNPIAYSNIDHSEVTSMERLSTRPDTRRTAFWQQVLHDCHDHRLSRLLASAAKVTDRRIFSIEENTGCRIELNETTVYSVRGLPCMQFRISSHRVDNLHRALVELETRFPKLYNQIVFTERFCDPSATGYGHQFPSVTEFFHGNQRHEQQQPLVSTVCRVIPVIEEAKTDRNTLSWQFTKRRRY